ncbi:hypothetical protein KBB05_05240 [Patescibacteria group bacterium]|jgi:hypothetical protein|nr:hypothetical protein [Patescibacteria group bacterium]
MDILALFEQISEGQLLIQQCIDFDMKEATLFKKIGGMIINSFFGDKTA